MSQLTGVRNLGDATVRSSLAKRSDDHVWLDDPARSGLWRVWVAYDDGVGVDDVEPSASAPWRAVQGTPHAPSTQPSSARPAIA